MKINKADLMELLDKWKSNEIRFEAIVKDLEQTIRIEESNGEKDLTGLYKWTLNHNKESLAEAKIIVDALILLNDYES